MPVSAVGLSRSSVRPPSYSRRCASVPSARLAPPLREAVDNLPPDPDTLAELRRLVASFGGSTLPDPTGEAFCEDCGQWSVAFPYATLSLCARDWLRRDLVAHRLHLVA